MDCSFRRSSAKLGCCLVVATVVALVGCGRGGVPRLSLRGQVTHGGESVPAGQIRFEPDTKRGGAGPVGFANIVDGEYDTRSSGKGPVAGPMRIIVKGSVSAQAFSADMFPPHTMEVDVSEETRVLDLEVPVSSKRGA